MTPAGVEPATFRFVAQYLNHCATAVPVLIKYMYNLCYICIYIYANLFFGWIMLFYIALFYWTYEGRGNGGMEEIA